MDIKTGPVLPAVCNTCVLSYHLNQQQRSVSSIQSILSLPCNMDTLASTQTQLKHPMVGSTYSQHRTLIISTLIWSVRVYNIGPFLTVAVNGFWIIKSLRLPFRMWTTNVWHQNLSHDPTSDVNFPRFQLPYGFKEVLFFQPTCFHVWQVESCGKIS